MEALLSNVRLRQQEKPARPLNQQQREAAHTDSSKPVMILAGAGSGKTSTLVARLLDMALCQAESLHLHKGAKVGLYAWSCVSPSVLMLTFTVKSTMEMRERLEHEGISKVCAFIKVPRLEDWCPKLQEEQRKGVMLASSLLKGMEWDRCSIAVKMPRAAKHNRRCRCQESGSRCKEVGLQDMRDMSDTVVFVRPLSRLRFHQTCRAAYPAVDLHPPPRMHALVRA
eukprot:312773-Pelagomonas_calceolata.AAC.2